MKIFVVFQCLFLLCVLRGIQETSSDEVKMHHRAKRMLWMTHDRKFILPQGTILDLAPRLQIPFIRQPPEGLNSDIQITWHFYMYFDKLGMTSNDHPWPFIKMPNFNRRPDPLYPYSGFFPYGNIPASDARPYFNRKSSIEAKNKKDGIPSANDSWRPVTPAAPAATDTNKEKEKDNSINDSSNNSTNDVNKDRIIIKPIQPRVPRSILELPPPEKLPGGERAMLIPQLEKMIANMGYDGRGCLLRAVCEIHEYPLHRTGYGLLGEVMTLVFSVSLSDYAESHLPEYLKAEEAGKSGECSSYFKNCSKSLFHWEEKNKYSAEMQNVVHTDHSAM